MKRRGALLIVLAAALALLTLTHPLKADVLHLKSGQTLEGKIIRETEDAIVIQKQAGTLTVPRDIIERIERKKSSLEIYQEQLAAAKTPNDLEALIRWCEAHDFDTREAREKLRNAVAAGRRVEHPNTYCQRCQAYGDVACEKCRGTGTTTGVCDHCAGSRTVICDLCGGSGRSQCGRCNGLGSKTVSCTACRGTGRGRCSKCRGVGHIKCFNHVRYIGAGSARCPHCRQRGGPGQIICPRCYDRRGQVTFPCRKCSQTGKVEIPCPLCGGRTTVQCLRCSARGSCACGICKGRGSMQTTCTTCAGRKRVPCSACGGTGLVTPKKTATKSRLQPAPISPRP